MDTLKIGDHAPDFAAPRDGGGTISLADHAGKPVVLYFYPKDDTPGCTKEAIGFTEAAADFAALGATVMGVSKDPVKKHDKFVAKHDLASRCCLTKTAMSANATAFGSKNRCMARPTWASNAQLI